jgi:TRAP-type uncharacterized transport system fused permease subunit
MENKKNKTTTLQWIFAITPIILLVFQLIFKQDFFVNQKQILRFVSFFLLTIGGFLNYRQNTDDKSRRAFKWVTIALGATTIIELNELTKLYF